MSQYGPSPQGSSRGCNGQVMCSRFVRSLEALVRAVTERRSLCMLALAQGDVFLDIHGELNRFKPGSFM
jgi:hypothetical protein